MKELGERFEYIILNTPTVCLVSDAWMIASFADTSFFVFRHEVRPKNHLKMIDKLYRENKLQNMNIMLNAINETNSYEYTDVQRNKYLYRQVENRN